MFGPSFLDHWFVKLDGATVQRIRNQYRRRGEDKGVHRNHERGYNSTDRQTDRQTNKQKDKYTPVYFRVAFSGAVALTVEKNKFKVFLSSFSFTYEQLACFIAVNRQFCPRNFGIFSFFQAFS